MTAHMNMIYIDTDGNARQTGVRAAMETDADTRIAFEAVRPLAVNHGDFLLDYYDEKEDLVDTLGIKKADFTSITGEPVKSDAEYRRIDSDYWSEARAQHAASKGTGDSK